MSRDTRIVILVWDSSTVRNIIQKNDSLKLKILYKNAFTTDTITIIYLTILSFSWMPCFLTNMSLNATPFWIMRRPMGMKEMIIVCIKKIHFPLVEVGLKLQIPLEISWTVMVVTTVSLLKANPSNNWKMHKIKKTY